MSDDRERWQQHTTKALELLIETGSTVELRAISKRGEKKRVRAGYFTDIEAAAAAAHSVTDFDGVYLTLNPVSPDLMARAAGRLVDGLQATADVNILRRRWLPIDVDPTRPAGISSNDTEKAAAKATVDEIYGELTILHEWPVPMLADSGNGWHLLYRIDLPNDDESRDLVKQVLLSLASRHDSETALVDTGVFNASRIWKCYGTMARKGDSIAERPHRRACVKNVPTSLDVVPLEALQAIAAMAPPPVVPARREQGAPLDGDAVTRARAYASRVPVPVEGQGSDAATFRMAATFVRDFGLGDSDALTLLQEWAPGFDAEWLESKIASANKYGKRAEGVKLDERRPPRSSSTSKAPPPAKPVTAGTISGFRALDIKGAIDDLDRIETGDMSRYIETGIKTLNRDLGGGWRRGEVTVIGALYGDGKTAMGVQFAVTGAEASKGNAIIVSPEMANTTLARREIERRARTSQWDRKPWRPSEIREAARTAHLRAASPLVAREFPVWHYSERTAGPDQVFRDAMAFAKERPLSLVVIDYAQAVIDQDSDRPHWQNVGHVANVCLEMAEALNVPVLLTSQLNSTKDNKGKVEYSFRETKLLEHRAHNVLLWIVEWREAEDDSPRQVKAAYFVARKMRDGPPFKRFVRYEPKYFLIEEMEWGQ